MFLVCIVGPLMYLVLVYEHDKCVRYLYVFARLIRLKNCMLYRNIMYFLHKLNLVV